MKEFSNQAHNFFSLYKLRRKCEKITLTKKITKLLIIYIFFFKYKAIFTFQILVIYNNKSIIIIYFLSFNFFIISTKCTWWLMRNTQFFLFSNFLMFLILSVLLIFSIITLSFFQLNKALKAQVENWLIKKALYAVYSNKMTKKEL